MKPLSNRAIRDRWRKRLFKAWLGASFVIAGYVGLAGPLTSYVGDGRSVVALAVPAVMLFMMLTGLGWLVLLAASRRSRTG